MKKNTFPIESFPRKITQIIRGMNEASGFPINFLATTILWVLAVAIGPSCLLAVKATWTVAANLYVGMVANKGKLKSPTLRFAKSALQAINDETLVSTGQKRQLLANDTTLEALSMLLFNNPYGLGVIRDELKGFFDSMNRYCKGGGDETTWLSAFNREPILINRKTDKQVVNILNPHISLIGTIQPEILKRMCAEAKANGFTERFLWAFPECDNPNLWHLSQEDVTGFYADSWAKITKDILSRGGFFDGTVKETHYELSSEAAKLFEEWQNNKAVEYFEDDELTAIFTKNAEQALRIALILHVTREVIGEVPRGNLIDLTSARNAIDIAAYFFEEAKNVLEITATPPFKEVPAWVEALPETFTTAEAIASADEHGGIKKRTVAHKLHDEDLFVRIDHGLYKKRGTADNLVVDAPNAIGDNDPLATTVPDGPDNTESEQHTNPNHE